MDNILINLKRIEISDDEDDVEELKTRRLKDQASKFQKAISRKQEVNNSFDSEGRNHNFFPKNTELKETDFNNSPVSDSEKKSLSNPEAVYDVVTDQRYNLCHSISSAENNGKTSTLNSPHGDTNSSKQGTDDFDYLGILDDNYLLNLFKEEDEQSKEHSTNVTSNNFSDNIANNYYPFDADVPEVKDDSCNSGTEMAIRNSDINKTETNEFSGKLPGCHEIDCENNIEGTRLNPPRIAKIGISYNEADGEEEDIGAYCTYSFCFFLFLKHLLCY